MLSVQKTIAVLATATIAAALGIAAAASAQAPPAGGCATQGSLGTAYTTGVNCRTMMLDGHRRRFIVYVPGTPPVTGSQRPAVFMFHGGSGTGEQFLGISGWREQSDRSGAISVYPTGERYRMLDTGRLTTHWNSFGIENKIDTVATPLADDVGFVDEMIADLQGLMAIDPRRVYASGFSNGAGFASRLALDRSTTFAAVAYSGATPSTLQSPARPVPTYATLGTLDDRVIDKNPPLTELPLDVVGILTTPTLDEFFDATHANMGLDPNDLGSEARRHSTTLRWPRTAAGPNGALFTFGMLEGLVHRYPNGTNNPAGFSAAPEFWAFFQANPLP